jgi:hypothetical protein
VPPALSIHMLQPMLCPHALPSARPVLCPRRGMHLPPHAPLTPAHSKPEGSSSDSPMPQPAMQEREDGHASTATTASTSGRGALFLELLSEVLEGRFWDECDRALPNPPWGLKEITKVRAREQNEEAREKQM